MSQYSSALQSQSAPAGSTLPAQPESPVALARVAETVAAIRASVEVAHLNPRREDFSGQRALEAMRHPRSAEEATYRYKRGGGEVTGPSVRLARELARCWGNVQTGLSIVSDDDDRVHIEGWAWDLEANIRVSKEAKFKKLIQRKRDGKTQWVQPDERDLDELIARRGAKLTRNAILELLPDRLIDAALSQADETLRDETQRESEEDPQQQIAKTCAAFEPWGVTPAQLLTEIGGQWSPDGIAHLRQVYRSIADSNSKVAEHFGSEPKEEQAPAGDAPRDLSDLDDEPWPGGGE